MLHPVWPLLASDERQGFWPPSARGLWNMVGLDRGGLCKGQRSSGERGCTRAVPHLQGVMENGQALLGKALLLVFDEVLLVEPGVAHAGASDAGQGAHGTEIPTLRAQGPCHLQRERLPCAVWGPEPRAPSCLSLQAGPLPWTLPTGEQGGQKIRATKNQSETWQGWRTGRQRGRLAEGGWLPP